jgi:hypothetical protein
VARLLNEPRRSVDACLDNAGEGFWVCEASTISSGLPTLAYRRHDDSTCNFLSPHIRPIPIPAIVIAEVSTWSVFPPSPCPLNPLPYLCLRLPGGLSLNRLVNVLSETPTPRFVVLPYISNNVGPVNRFLSALVPSPLGVVFLVLLRPLLRRPRLARNLSIGFQSDLDISSICTSTMITSSNSPFQGAGCPIMWTAFYFTPCPVPSCPAYEPHLTDCEYSQPFRHIQYNSIAIRRPIATLAMLLCRRIARCT